MIPTIFLFIALELKVDKVLSIFENATPEIQYCYIENIRDGRGYTAGKAGFTTGTGDFYEFAKNYEKVNQETVLKKYLPELKRLAQEESEDVKGLRGMVKAWRSECHRKDFEGAQDALVEAMYKSPARAYQRQLGFSSALSYLVIYDTLIQHGDGDDPDSFQGVLKRMGKARDEKQFLKKFLEAREQILLNASDDSTRAEWRESVDRVYALRRILEEGNLSLEKLHLSVWGKDWQIE